MTNEEMAAIVDESHRMGRRVAAHAEGLAGTRWAIEAGADTIEHGLALHRDPALLDEMAKRGTVLVPTLTTFHDLAERFASDFAPPLVEQAKRQLEEALKTVGRLRSAGVTLALGYDSGPPGASANELLRLAEAGLSRSTRCARQRSVARLPWAGRISGASLWVRRPTWWSSMVDRTRTSRSSRAPGRSHRCGRAVSPSRWASP